MHGLGSSDISAIVGENPFKTRHRVWLDKIGLIDDDEETEQAWLGHVMEPILGAWYAEQMGVAVVRGPGTMVHPDHPWMLATTDFEHADGSAVVEAKSVGWRVEHHWNENEEEGVPHYVMTQVQHQLAVRGIGAAAVPVLFTSDARKRIFRVRRDQRIIDALIVIGERFWRDHVLARTPPPVDGSDDAREILTRLYPRHMTPLAPAPVGSFDAACAYIDAREAEKKARADASLAGNRLRKFIGDAEGIEGTDWRATWRSNKNDQRSLRVTIKNREAA
jgi:putative phage-type endonuclease